MDIGVIGTGLMGAPMALRLLTSGHRVWAYNRTPSKLISLQLAGARVCASPAAVLAEAEAIVLMLTDAAAIDSVLFSADLPLCDRTFIQMGTISPADSQALAARFSEAGAHYLECPVLGSIPEAKNGQLILMVGATAEAFAQWQPVLRCFGPEPLLVGPVGSAAALKLALNQLIGSLTAAFAQSLALVQRQGIAVDDFMGVLRGSAVYAPTFDKKLKRMVKRQFQDPNFPAKHLLKDMNLFMETAAAAGLDTTAAAAVYKLVERSIEGGNGDADYSSLYAQVFPLLPQE